MRVLWASALPTRGRDPSPAVALQTALHEQVRVAAERIGRRVRDAIHRGLMQACARAARRRWDLRRFSALSLCFPDLSLSLSSVASAIVDRHT